MKLSVRKMPKTTILTFMFICQISIAICRSKTTISLYQRDFITELSCSFELAQGGNLGFEALAVNS